MHNKCQALISVVAASGAVPFALLVSQLRHLVVVRSFTPICLGVLSCQLLELSHSFPARHSVYLIDVTHSAVPAVFEFGAARIALVVVRSQQDGASADATGFFNAFVLNLIVEVHRVRVVHAVPAAEVVIVVVRHNRNQYSRCTKYVKH